MERAEDEASLSLPEKNKMLKKVLWILLAVLAVIIGLYPSLFFMGEKRAGILKAKPDALFSNIFWYFSFHVHLVSGGLALLSGWVQFNARIRYKSTRFHRWAGKLYVSAALLSAPSGFYIAFYATGGLPVALGFMSLSTIWFYTTLMAYRHIRKGRVPQHRNNMIYSYACCFAAVTLRLWMPLLVPVFGNFKAAYTFMAWWCWIPNLAIAYGLTRRPVTVTEKKG